MKTVSYTLEDFLELKALEHSSPHLPSGKQPSQADLSKIPELPPELWAKAMPNRYFAIIDNFLQQSK